MNAPLLVNTLGHAAGVLLFGIFLVLLTQDKSTRVRNKPLIAAALALAWNLASLIVLGLGPSDSIVSRIVIAIGFSVLSFLPAVLFDLCLEGRGSNFVRAGYALSIVTMIPHVAEIFQPDSGLHRQAMGAIAIGFGLLTAITAFQEKGTRTVSVMALFLLAASFVHLGEGHAEQIWSQELALHHAGIPLALLVLLQDYRFILLDAFLRLVANGILAAIFVTVSFLVWRAGAVSAPTTEFALALSLVGGCLVLVLFAVARTRVQRWLTRVLFARPDEAQLLESLRVPVRDAEAYLRHAAELLGAYLAAPAWIGTGSSDSAAEAGDRAEPLHGDARVVVKTTAGGQRAIEFGRRTGGRRYLSEDLALLARAGDSINEQLDLHRELEMRRLVAQAELRALQSQIHPHFLFNALNALYGVIPREAKGARETVLNLADIFRYFLDTRKTMVALSEEMHIVRAYLDIEQLRLGDKLRVSISVGDDAQDMPIPVLSIQPLAENAVKHGVAPLSSGGEVSIEARREPDGGLFVAVSDTGRGFDATPHGGGVGLENVRRRLELSYGGAAHLDVYSGPQGSTVTLLIPAHAMSSVGVAR